MVDVASTTFGARGEGPEAGVERGSGVQPGVDGSEQAGADRVGGGGAEDRHAGDFGQLLGSEAVHVAGDLVLLNQAAPEEQRVVGAERDRYPGLE